MLQQPCRTFTVRQSKKMSVQSNWEGLNSLCIYDYRGLHDGMPEHAATQRCAAVAVQQETDSVAALAQEIDREAGQGEISLEQLRGMPYTEACVKEALRLFPPVTALARQAQQDTTILGHHVPKGAGIMVSHHSARPGTTWADETCCKLRCVLAAACA